MTFVISIYDLFAYMIPGSLYITLFAYIGDRVGWFDLIDAIKSPSILVLIGLAIASYIVGQATYRLGALLERLNRSADTRDFSLTKATFIERDGINPDRPFLKLSAAVLLAAAELNNKDAAVEISRLRAVGIMMRNVAVPLLLAAITAAVEIFTGPQPFFAGLAGLLLVLVAAGCVRRGSTLRIWANGKTLELCYWIKDIDETVRSFAAAQSPDSAEPDPAPVGGTA